MGTEPYMDLELDAVNITHKMDIQFRYCYTKNNIITDTAPLSPTA